MPLKGIEAQRTKPRKRLPTVLTAQEVALRLRGVSTQPTGLAVRLLYGCGLRVTAALSLRVKDVDLAGGKGDKDRVVGLPKSLLPAPCMTIWRKSVAGTRRIATPGHRKSCCLTRLP